MLRVLDRLADFLLRGCRGEAEQQEGEGGQGGPYVIAGHGLSPSGLSAHP